MEMRLDGKVIPVARGEAIVCEIPLGICKLIVIANIPDIGDKAVVYVKVRPMQERVKGEKSRPEKKARPQPEVIRR